MKKFFSLFIFLLNLFLCSTFVIIEEQQLKGIPISSESSSSLLNNAFDGDLTTEFKSSQNSNGWIGLQLNNAYRITKIGWAQKGSDKENYLLGIFEA